MTVIDMRFCRWCNATCPVGHDCPAGAVGCTTRQPDDFPCGCCASCLAAQTADLQHRSLTEMGGGA